MKKRTRFEGFSLYFHDWTNGSKENYRVSLVWQIAFKWSRGGVDHRSVGKEDESRWVCAEKLHCGPADQIAALLSTCIIQINAIYFLGPFLRAARRTPTLPFSAREQTVRPLYLNKRNQNTKFRKIKYSRCQALDSNLFFASFCAPMFDRRKKKEFALEGKKCVETTPRSLKNFRLGLVSRQRNDTAMMYKL